MRIAIWLHGGIGGGNFSQGQPTLGEIITRLSQKHDITVYSVLPANANFQAQGFKLRTGKRWVKNVKLRYFFLCLLFLKDHIANRFKIIHAFWAYPAGTFAVLLGKIIGIPSLVTLQGGEGAAIPSIKYGNMLSANLKKITLWTCEQASCLTSISSFLLRNLQHHGLKRQDALVIPFGVNREVFKFSSKQRSGILNIIHVANLTEVKDQVTLLNAFSIITATIPSHLTIIGGDYLKGKIRQQAEALGLQNSVTFISEVPQSELHAYYEKADVMMHTSLYEGMASVVIEAMACGVVVCGTAVGIMDDYKDHFFRTVEVGDFRSLANEVLHIWRDRDLYLRLQERAYKWVIEHDMNWTIQQYDNVYLSMVQILATASSGEPPYRA